MNTISDNTMHHDKEHEIYKDAERFSWLFSATEDKPTFALDARGMYRTTLIDRGFLDHWSMDKWRAVIDQAMQTEDDAEDAELNRKLTESLSKARQG